MVVVVVFGAEVVAEYEGDEVEGRDTEGLDARGAEDDIEDRPPPPPPELNPPLASATDGITSAVETSNIVINFFIIMIYLLTKSKF